MSLPTCCPYGGRGDNKGESKRLRESQENGENPEVITGPEEDMGIPNGTNGITKMGTRGPRISAFLRSLGRQAAVKTLDVT